MLDSISRSNLEKTNETLAMTDLNKMGLLHFYATSGPSSGSGKKLTLKVAKQSHAKRRSNRATGDSISGSNLEKIE